MAIINHLTREEGGHALPAGGNRIKSPTDKERRHRFMRWH